MTLKFIHDFHINLHNTLSKDELLRLKFDKIYVSVVQDAKYPFLLINILKAENLSNSKLAMFEVEFEICIFTRDRNQTNLTILADLIDTKLNSKNCQIAPYTVAGMRLQSLDFERGKDLITSKLTMFYNSIIKGSDE